MLGVRHVHQGRNPKFGVDCIGLIMCALKMLGLEGFDRPEYLLYRRRPPRGRGMLEEFERQCGEGFAYEHAQPGDIAVFWVSDETKRAHHCGVLAEGGRMIHTHGKFTIGVTEQGISEYWEKRLIACFRVPGLED